MKRSRFVILSALVGLSGAGLIVSQTGPLGGGRAVAQNPAGTSSPVALLASPGAPDIVDASNAFLALLTEKQRGVALIELNPRLAGRWSNFPGGSNLRNGVFLKEMNETQSAAALKLARMALGEDGFHRFQEIRAADDNHVAGGGGPGGRGPGGGPGGPGGPGGMFDQSDANKDGKLSKDEAPGFLRDRFAEVDTNKDGFISREEDTAAPRPRGPGGGPGGPGGGPGGMGGGGSMFSSANFMFAFLGQPSKTSPWLLQIGGHHLAFNLYYKGTTSAASPYFLGVEPVSWKDKEGKTHDPMAPMREAMQGILGSLSPDQLKLAKLGSRFNDVYVGPGRDGKFPAKSEGVPASDLSSASKDFIKQAILAWTGDNLQAADYQKLYLSDLDKVKVAFSGSTSLNEVGDYIRIDGPRVWIEFCTQRGIHYHSIWRDRVTDYGAEFSY